MIQQENQPQAETKATWQKPELSILATEATEDLGATNFDGITFSS